MNPSWQLNQNKSYKKTIPRLLSRRLRWEWLNFRVCFHRPLDLGMSTSDSNTQYRLKSNFSKCIIFPKKQKNVFGNGKPIDHRLTATLTITTKTLGMKDCKNCECCPGHYLTVNHYSLMSWFHFRNLSVIVNYVTKSLIITVRWSRNWTGLT